MPEAPGDRPDPYPPSPRGGGVPPPYAGAPPNRPPQGRSPGRAQPPELVAVPFKDTSGTNAVVGLVMGVLALLLCWIPFVNLVSVIIGGLGVLFSILGFRQQNASRAMSLVGIILNGLALLVVGIYVLFFLAIAGSATAGT